MELDFLESALKWHTVVYIVNAVGHYKKADVGVRHGVVGVPVRPTHMKLLKLTFKYTIKIRPTFIFKNKKKMFWLVLCVKYGPISTGHLHAPKAMRTSRLSSISRRHRLSQTALYSAHISKHTSP